MKKWNLRKAGWIFILPILLFGLTPNFTHWNSMSANGSSVIVHSKGSATFRIVRKNSGPKQDINTQSYAYLLSNSIALPSNWRKIVFKGEWWQMPSSRKNYEEMNIFVYGSYPLLPHGTVRNHNIRVTNYAEISYDTWHGIVRFTDQGKSSDRVRHEITRAIPTHTTPFRLIIERNPENNKVSWIFYEKRENRWEKLYRQENSRLFEGTNNRKIFLKIGGWCSWEYPIVSKLRFRKLDYTILTDNKINESINSNKADKETQTATGATQKEKRLCNESNENVIAISCNKDFNKTIVKNLVFSYADGIQIPIAGKCRGVCGGGCPQEKIIEKLPNLAVQLYDKTKSCYYIVYYKNIGKYGTHLGCRFHDACFDTCRYKKGEKKDIHGIPPEYIGEFHNFCNEQVIKVFGVDMGGNWMVGNGPYDNHLVFWGDNNVTVEGPFDSNKTIASLKSDGFISLDTNVIPFSNIKQPKKSLYAIEVWTGDVDNASTDSPIALTLYDDKNNSSGEIVLPLSPFPMKIKSADSMLLVPVYSKIKNKNDQKIDIGKSLEMSLLNNLQNYLQHPTFLGIPGVNQTVLSLDNLFKTKADIEKFNKFLQKWDPLDGFEKGHHEAYLFLLGDYIDNIDHITLRRLDKDPAALNLISKGIPQLEKYIGRKLYEAFQQQPGSSAVTETAKQMQNLGESVINELSKNSEIKDRVDAISSQIDNLKNEVNNIKNIVTKKISDKTRNNTDWYCKRVRVYRQVWNSFDTKIIADIPVNGWITTTPVSFKTILYSHDLNDNNFTIYSYDNQNKQLLAIDPLTGKAKVVSHPVLPMVADLSPTPDGKALYALGHRSPNIRLYLLHPKKGTILPLKKTNMKFAEAVEYDPTNNRVIGAGRDRLPGTYDSYLFVSFDPTTGDIMSRKRINIKDLDAIARNPFDGTLWAIDNQPDNQVILWLLDPQTQKGKIVKRWRYSELFGYDGMIGIAFTSQHSAYGLLHKGNRAPLQEYRLVRIDLTNDFSLCLLPERNLGMKEKMHLSAPTAILKEP